MTSSSRLWAVAAFLAAAALISSSSTRGDTKKFGPSLPEDGSRPAGKVASAERDTAAVPSRFDAGGIQTYKPLQGEQLFAWQIKPDLGKGVERPRDILVMISTTATQAGRNWIA